MLLTIPTTLPDNITINGYDYDTIELFRRIEKITGKKFICKRENKPLRNLQNTTIQITILQNWGTLKIIGKGKVYTLNPCF
jgi:hypothetical protein